MRFENTEHKDFGSLSHTSNTTSVVYMNDFLPANEEAKEESWDTHNIKKQKMLWKKTISMKDHFVQEWLQYTKKIIGDTATQFN